MNWNVFIIMIILSIIAAYCQYKIEKVHKIKSVIVLLIGFAISVLSGLLFNNDSIEKNPDSSQEYNIPNDTFCISLIEDTTHESQEEELMSDDTSNDSLSDYIDITLFF